jgi:uncharacterized protein
MDLDCNFFRDPLTATGLPLFPRSREGAGGIQGGAGGPPAGSQGGQPCEGWEGIDTPPAPAGDAFAGAIGMNVMRSSDGRYLLVFAKDEDFMETLKGFLEKERIGASRLAGIGAFRRATIAYYRREKQDYDRVEIDEQVELTSLVGNSSLDEEGGVKIHAHVNLGRSDMSVIGGHLMEGEVWPTLELFVEPLDAAVVRKMDEETRLPMISS